MSEKATLSYIEAIRRFNRYYTNLLGLLNRRRLESPYSLAEARVLLEIGQQENCTASYLKDLLQIDFGYLSRIIRKLLHDQVIREEKSPRDGRLRYLQLTEKGAASLAAIHEMSDQQVERLVRRLSEADLAELVLHMQAIESILTKKAGLQ